MKTRLTPDPARGLKSVTKLWQKPWKLAKFGNENEADLWPPRGLTTETKLWKKRWKFAKFGNGNEADPWPSKRFKFRDQTVKETLKVC